MKPYQLGVLGGGQLGKMLIAEARRMDISVAVLDPAADAPCAPLADRFICGSFDDPDAIAALVACSEVITYEIEHIDAAALQRLQRAGHRLVPDARVLALVQDKLAQRRLFEEAGLPGPRYCEFSAHDEAALVDFGLPAVQKARRGGYDGRGVAVLRSSTEPRIDRPSLLEELVEIERELAVLVVRGAGGAVVSYQPVEMIFDTRSNICTHVVAPAELDPGLAAEAVRIAETAVETLGGVGVHGVELFLARDGRMLLNEIAPRPHNSGHYTIEACVTSQFEQHLRAVLGFPLGSSEALAPAVMVNLLGKSGCIGATVVEGSAEALAVPGVSLHLYGKRQCVGGRKMGHITAVARDAGRAMQRAQTAASLLTIRGGEYVT